LISGRASSVKPETADSTASLIDVYIDARFVTHRLEDDIMFA
jgi:hypothetical protein